MKQLLQDLSNGETIIIDAPSPNVSRGTLLINTRKTLISAGTERMIVDFGKSNLLSKAQKQPDKVKLVIEKMKTDGVFSTLDAIKSKLSQPIPLGYSNVGVVESVGEGISKFSKGDRVVSNGRHADVVKSPINLCAKIPDNVSDEEATFTVVSSIALQGVRLAKPTIGETFVIIGAGLIGLIAIQLLKIQGVKVLAMDLDPRKLELAKMFGAETYLLNDINDPVKAGLNFSSGSGIDGVLITAATTSNKPIENAAKMSRKRGRIILIGVAGLNINRSDFYEKELTLQVSCSYGPGRYDQNYEQYGNDYPIGYVRWTEKRNFEAILELLSSRSLSVKKLISHRFLFEEANKAYSVLHKSHDALGIILSYSDIDDSRHNKIQLIRNKNKFNSEKPTIAFIGAGNYASRVLIPAFKKAGANLDTIVSVGGVSSVFHGGKFGFSHASTDLSSILDKKNINTVVIATRHDSHAELVRKSLIAGKNIFVEKPLVIKESELIELKSLYQEFSKQKKISPKLMVGYNRRFSPLVKKIKELLVGVNEPKSFVMTMNAGKIDSNHWTQKQEIGGGRIIGEACHYIDLMYFLASSSIKSIHAIKMNGPETESFLEDKVIITMGFKDGSIGTINYLANGHSSFPKERIEVFTSGKILQIDNFRRLNTYGFGKINNIRLFKKNKGQEECPKSFLNSIEKGEESPIKIQDIFEVAQATLEVTKILRNH